VPCGNLESDDLEPTAVTPPSQVYTLSIFIAITNGFWPYFRLILLFGVMLVPKFPRKFVDPVLQFCEVMGKWMLAQMVVLVMQMVGFRYHIQLTPNTTEPAATADHGVTHSAMVAVGAPQQQQQSAFGAADIQLEPDWYGYWGILLAALFGIVGSHVILSSARLYIWWPVHKLASLQVDRVALRTKSRPWVQITATAMLIGTAGALLVLMYQPAFVFEFRGAVMVLQEGTHTQTSKWYSLWDIPMLVPSLSPEAFGGFVMAAALIIFGVVVPLVHACLLLAIWFVPATPQTWRKAVVVSESVGAWSALDMVVLTMVIAFGQVGQFARFIVGDKCDALGPILKLPKIAALLHGDEQCLDVHATILPVLWTLLGVGFAMAGTTQFVAHKLRSAVDDAVSSTAFSFTYDADDRTRGGAQPLLLQ
jgi:hypothetical protein